ncbi:MAG: N-acetylmuramoyl-L-alanine amidase [Actinomycetota bacterium]|nr:N-acetylmuramoyl-L-alanine amidase [Actinomycetota bacterium]
MVATLFATGLVPAPAPPRPVVEGRTTPLTAEAATRGWQRRVDSGIDAEMIGFDWEGRSPGEVEIRVLRDGAWSDWIHVEGRIDEGPDPGSAEHDGRTSAGPVWVGDDVRHVEVRVDEGRLPDLEMHAIDSEEVGGFGTRPAGASAAQPPIITRAQWGADESWRTVAPGCDGSPDYAGTLRNAIVHHTASSNTYSKSDAAAAIRGIYYFHTNTNKWCDIGYNFIVDRYGQVFEGRAGGIDRAVIGAHAGGFNTGSTGVALLGSFQETNPPAEAYSSLVSLLAWKLSVHEVSAQGTVTVTSGGSTRYPAGTQVTLSTISGHRDVSNTVCPGDLSYGRLSELRDDVATAQGASGGGSSQLAYGNADDIPLTCDWDGNGTDTPGVFRRGRFYLRNDGPEVWAFNYGNGDDVPICGDWDGNGADTVGVKRGGTWYLRNRNTTGIADLSFGYGNSSDVPVTGDWDGNGTDTVGVKRGGTWYLRNRNTTGIADLSFGYGNSGDIPVTGDWDGNGSDTPGVQRGSTWYLRNRNTTGIADLTFRYGNDGDWPLSGDWDGDGTDTVGVRRGITWYFRG